MAWHGIAKCPVIKCLNYIVSNNIYQIFVILKLFEQVNKPQGMYISEVNTCKLPENITEIRQKLLLDTKFSLFQLLPTTLVRE